MSCNVVLLTWVSKKDFNVSVFNAIFNLCSNSNNFYLNHLVSLSHDNTPFPNILHMEH